MQSQGCAGKGLARAKGALAEAWRMAACGTARRRGCAFAVALGLVAATAPARVFAAEANPPGPDKDWPCAQILVEQISLPAVWAGPPIEGIDWRRDSATANLVALAAARRTPLETAEKAIESFAASAGADKNTKLTALFAGLFETLNDERTQIINGLKRFGRKQKALAVKIRAENAEIQKKSGRLIANRPRDGRRPPGSKAGMGPARFR